MDRLCGIREKSLLPIQSTVVYLEIVDLTDDDQPLNDGKSTLWIILTLLLDIFIVEACRRIWFWYEMIKHYLMGRWYIVSFDFLIFHLQSEFFLFVFTTITSYRHNNPDFRNWNVNDVLIFVVGYQPTTIQLLLDGVGW